MIGQSVAEKLAIKQIQADSVACELMTSQGISILRMLVIGMA